jgi:hypothetical protein
MSDEAIDDEDQLNDEDELTRKLLAITPEDLLSEIDRPSFGTHDSWEVFVPRTLRGRWDHLPLSVKLSVLLTARKAHRMVSD